MRIEELSIGDWVMNLYANNPSRVIGLRTMFRDTYEIIAVSNDTQYMLIEDKELHNYEPIPLTPEILEKNGFVKEEDEYGNKRYSLIEGGTKFSLGYARSVFQWTSPIDVRFVHKLQHLLRFCGLEKEIEV